MSPFERNLAWTRRKWPDQCHPERTPLEYVCECVLHQDIRLMPGGPRLSDKMLHLIRGSSEPKFLAALADQIEHLLRCYAGGSVKNAIRKMSNGCFIRGNINSELETVATVLRQRLEQTART